jgi:hypothetical protein
LALPMPTTTATPGVVTVFTSTQNAVLEQSEQEEQSGKNSNSSDASPSTQSLLSRTPLPDRLQRKSVGSLSSSRCRKSDKFCWRPIQQTRHREYVRWQRLTEWPIAPLSIGGDVLKLLKVEDQYLISSLRFVRGNKLVMEPSF